MIDLAFRDSLVKYHESQAEILALATDRERKQDTPNTMLVDALEQQRVLHVTAVDFLGKLSNTPDAAPPEAPPVASEPAATETANTAPAASEPTK